MLITSHMSLLAHSQQCPHPVIPLVLWPSSRTSGCAAALSLSLPPSLPPPVHVHHTLLSAHLNVHHKASNTTTPVTLSHQHTNTA